MANQRVKKTHGARLVATLVAAGVAASGLSLAKRAFLPAPRATEVHAGSIAAAMVTVAAPLAANAMLPPLEDLPLEEVAPIPEPPVNNFFGIPPAVGFTGIACAALWAGFWVNNMTPKKEEEGVYKTYIGAGEIPPEGYTNPLDPRVDEAYTDQEDPLYKKSKAGRKSAGSAVV
eukprot:TRINITY_DN814_c0_g3_i1.p1 TRINITY_DN814_c0_g3~~TRINITY_DN814_c0_g3_i1.p1  ORF type:complete len:174 (+),score=46.80 TRINITY_DN814_c0_g3_i1:80-601(+)